MVPSQLVKTLFFFAASNFLRESPFSDCGLLRGARLRPERINTARNGSVWVGYTRQSALVSSPHPLGSNSSTRGSSAVYPEKTKLVNFYKAVFRELNDFAIS